MCLFPTLRRHSRCKLSITVQQVHSLSLMQTHTATSLPAKVHSLASSKAAGHAEPRHRSKDSLSRHRTSPHHNLLCSRHSRGQKMTVYLKKLLDNLLSQFITLHKRASISTGNLTYLYLLRLYHCLDLWTVFLFPG